MNDEFLPIDDAAKELGISPGRIRARLLEGHYIAFVCVAQEYAVATQDEFLPAWEPSEFPSTQWRDFGTNKSDQRNGTLRVSYRITGWLALHPNELAKILSTGGIALYGQWVYVPRQLNSNPDNFVPVQIVDQRYQPQDDGPILGESSIYLSMSNARTQDGVAKVGEKTLSTKERSTWLRIIDALAVIAKIPDRGGAISVEKQIQELGYDGPIDDTIRGILSEARLQRPTGKKKAG